MSFWETLGNSAMKAFGGAVGGQAATMGFDALNNPKNSRSENRKNYHQDMEQQQRWTNLNAKLGRDMDVGAQQEMFDFRMQRGKAAGMTDYEMYMGPAAGAGGGTGAATTTLGNSGASTGAQLRQSQMQQKIASEEKQKDRMTSLAQTAMQTDTAKDIANINAGTQKAGQENQLTIAQAQQAIDRAYKEGRLKLDRDAFEKNVQLIDSQIDLNEMQTKKLINEVATSKPKFIMALKQLSMGPANLLVELTLQNHGVTIQNFQKMPADKRAAVIAEVLAMASTINVEGQGLAQLATTVIQALQKGSSSKPPGQRDIEETLGNAEKGQTNNNNQFSVPGSAFPRG